VEVKDYGAMDLAVDSGADPAIDSSVWWDVRRGKLQGSGSMSTDSTSGIGKSFTSVCASAVARVMNPPDGPHRAPR